MKGKILYMEDDVLLRDVLMAKLKQAGYEVSAANNGQEGITLAQKEKFDLILLDLVMPGVDGFEVLTQFRQNEKMEATPVIILSNLSEPEDMNRGRGLGALVYLTKASVTPAEILEVVEQTLAK